MDVTAVAAVTGMAASTLNLALESYRTLKRSNVKVFFGKLVESGVDLKAIGDQEDLGRCFLSVVDRVANEAHIRKIDCWKNAVVHLATDFRDFQLRDTFISALGYLTVFDLTVVHKVYSTDFAKEGFEEEIAGFFTHRNVPIEYVRQALKRLASHNLISEQFDRSFMLGAGLTDFNYVKNAIGPEFLHFISTEYSKTASGPANDL
ncbi:MAG: hypothetical protein ACM3ZU_13550 [Bacteroidota bacterium]